MPGKWTGEELLELARAFQPACVLMAAAELDLFAVLRGRRMTAEALAAEMSSDARGTGVLCDALAAMGLLEKYGGRYALAAGTEELLVSGGPGSVLAMLRHLANCQRRWAQLARVVKDGSPARCEPSVRGEREDLEAFIEAMHDVSRAMAPALLGEIGPPEFTHLLDLGGGPGTWTIAFLRAAPAARATLLDLPDVIPIARAHVEAAGLADRVTFVAADMDDDTPLPVGADLTWVSAVVHQNSRQDNRRLFAKVRAALADGGRILIRDVVMDRLHTAPAAGALFAVNMLVGTPGGGTYSFEELAEDLQQAGFDRPRLLHAGKGMDSVVEAIRAD